MTTEVNPEMMFTWAYDGSGVALRIPVKVHSVFANFTYPDAVISFETKNDEIRFVLNKHYRPTWRGDTCEVRVSVSSLTPVGSPPDLMSFNWLD